MTTGKRDERVLAMSLAPILGNIATAISALGAYQPSEPNHQRQLGATTTYTCDGATFVVPAAACSGLHKRDRADSGLIAVDCLVEQRVLGGIFHLPVSPVLWLLER
jgi:hypothetical protein